jgi:VanZ family protein
MVHHLLRKLGHFSGYGTLGLLFRKAWYRSVRVYMNMIGSQLAVAATMLAVSFTFLVGCLDEWHQSMIPGRTSTRTDVLIDTCGALLFNLIFWGIRAYRRRQALKELTEWPARPATMLSFR